MTIAITNPVPVPAGATPDIWQDDTPQPSRVVHGVCRAIEGRDDVLVGTTAIQFADGSVDDGSRVESPHVYVETCADRGLTAAQARELAAAILECANEVDGWAGK
jgi:hypothetical protein